MSIYIYRHLAGQTRLVIYLPNVRNVKTYMSIISPLFLLMNMIIRQCTQLHQFKSDFFYFIIKIALIHKDILQTIRKWRSSNIVVRLNCFIA